LTPGERRRYDLIYEPASRDLLRGDADSVAEALRRQLGRKAKGEEHTEFHELAGRGRRDYQRLFRGSETMPLLTPDGVYDAKAATWRQRSLIGEQWSLVARSRRMTDEQLSKELRQFRGRTVRAYDPETGKVVRVSFETDVQRFRQFAESSQARQERVISPRRGEGRV
jgi:hypothetical protein